MLGAAWGRWEIALSSRQVGTPRNDKFMVREWVFGAGWGRWERCWILDAGWVMPGGGYSGRDSALGKKDFGGKGG
jgi:hypothetical protein